MSRYKPLKTNGEYYERPLVCCPVCGNEYVHFSGKLEFYPSSDADYEFWDGSGCRGGVIRSGMWCENGHTFDLCIAQHKGIVFLETDGDSEGTIDFEREMI